MSQAHNLWLTTLNALNKRETEAAGEIWEDLHSAYSSPERFYHTISHIDKMAKSMEEFAPNASIALRMAILFHDAVYDSRSSKNEEESAAYASAVLRKLGCSEQLQKHTSELILCTKKHIPLELELADDSSMLLDLDLLILGSSPAEYDEYAKNVRAEYSWVAEDQFARGRAAILHTFLSRERIFFCQKIRERYEAVARTNLLKELSTLG
jgi:predicted metal-dependent HD superfamily phosphohydrolase